MATEDPINGNGAFSDLEGVTLGNVDLSDRDLVARIRERDLAAARIRINQAVRRLQDLGVIDAEGRRKNKTLPPDMLEDSQTDFGG